MPADIESMFYAGETPWHGLGTQVGGLLKAAHAVKKAGLDWTVEGQPIFVPRGRGYDKVEGWVALTRKSDKRVFGCATDSYRIIQNAEIFDLLDSLVESKEAKYETAGALGNGARVWMLLSIAAVKGLQIKGDPSRTNGYLLATTAHDGTAALQLRPTFVRVVCRNTLNMALGAKGNTFSIRHTGDPAAKLEQAREALGIVNRFAQEFRESMLALADTPLPKGYVKRFLEELVPIPQEMERTKGREATREAIAHVYAAGAHLTGVPGSAYRLLQAVVEYADYDRPYRGEGRERAESRLRAIADGPALTLKQDALDLLRKDFELVPVPAVAAGRN